MDDLKRPHPTDVVVGGRVRAARAACGLSQGALAEAIGVTFQQVQKYENGSNRISASKLVEIATTLRVSASSFLAGLGDCKGDNDDRRTVERPEAVDLLSAYSRLPPHMRKAVLEFTTTLSAGIKG
ncbi:helix-turn-helix transcriptional regulator [Phenylobacterium sp.]|jgi:transcriptional regulator with XRE-family HTH domain|uniref:helix-turn-helix domain-containing protein n=1 Tax=Phenylobacterium sp. TaxID=1871053 RepID=UPI002F4050B7